MIKADKEEVGNYNVLFIWQCYNILCYTIITVYTVFLGISHADFCFQHLLLYSNSYEYLNAAKHAAIHNCSSSVTSLFLTVQYIYLARQFLCGLIMMNHIQWHHLYIWKTVLGRSLFRGTSWSIGCNFFCKQENMIKCKYVLLHDWEGITEKYSVQKGGTIPRSRTEYFPVLPDPRNCNNRFIVWLPRHYKHGQ